MIQNFDVVVIGAGPAGMAAALSASEIGVKTLLIERDGKLGGILNQCVHSGFGAKYFNREVSGPEYVQMFINKVNESNISVLVNSFVTEVSQEKVLTILSHGKGMLRVKAKSVVFAMGCRERTAGALPLAGDRPVGIWTAGMAQHFANVDGKLVGKDIVILGSGDVGLITARRMIQQGATVKMVCEIMPYSSGHERNLEQCLRNNNVPLLLSTTITRVVGKVRVEGVFVAEVDENRKPKLETERFVPCDSVLLSVGLIPENELALPLEICMDKITNGAIVDEYRHTDKEGFFACGNTLHVHDLVDNVSEEAHIAGTAAALYALGKLPKGAKVSVAVGEGVRYVLPQRITLNDGCASFFLRVSKQFSNATLVVKSGETIISKKECETLSPGEMCSIKVDKTLIVDDITICVKRND